MQLLNESTVLPEEIDSLGHMNVRHYMARMERANQNLLEQLGMDDAVLLTCFLRRTDTYTRFRREQFEGATLHTLGGILTLSADGMRSYIEIQNPNTQDVAATFIVTTTLIDQISRTTRQLKSPSGAEVQTVDIPTFAQPRSLSLDKPATEVSLELLEQQIPDVEGGGMMSGKRQITVEDDDVDADGWLREDIELMFLPFAKLAQQGEMPQGPPVFQSESGQRVGWAVMESRTQSFAQPHLGDRLAYFSADLGVQDKTRVSRRWAFNKHTGAMLGISDTVGVCIDLDARRAISWPSELREQIERYQRPELA